MERKAFLVAFLLLVLSLEYKFTSAGICGSNVTVLNNASFGKFSSPNFPNNYPDGTIKIWKIVAPVGQVIDLYFSSFALERSKTCENDYVKIRNNCGDISPMAVYCDHTARPLRSSSNVLWVEFRSDLSDNDKGFEAIFVFHDKYNQLLSCPRPSDSPAYIDYCLVKDQVQCCNKDDSNCRVNKILAANSGKITSPGHPGYYPNGVRYLWRVTVPEGYVVQINFTTLVTHHSSGCSDAQSNCKCDYVHVLDGPCPYYNVGPRWCGAWTSNNKYPSYTTTGRHMVLFFRSDLTTNQVGFSANYRIALKCSGNKPYSCLNGNVPACCATQGASVLYSSTNLSISMVIMITALLQM